MKILDLSIKRVFPSLRQSFVAAAAIVGLAIIENSGSAKTKVIMFQTHLLILLVKKCRYSTQN